MNDEDKEKAILIAKATLVSNFSQQIIIFANLYMDEEVVLPSMAAAYMKQGRKMLGKEQLKVSLAKMINAVDVMPERIADEDDE